MGVIGTLFTGFTARLLSTGVKGGCTARFIGLGPRLSTAFCAGAGLETIGFGKVGLFDGIGIGVAPSD